MKGGLLCRQILMKGAQCYRICCYNEQRRDKHHYSGPHCSSCKEADVVVVKLKLTRLAKEPRYEILILLTSQSRVQCEHVIKVWENFEEGNI